MHSSKKTLLLVALSLISVALVSGCKATEVPTDWKQECVGRMQFSLPQDIEMATSSLENFKSHYIEIGFEQGEKPANFEFVDGQVAINDTLMKIRFVSGKLAPDEILKLRSQFWTSYATRQISAKTSKRDYIKNSKYKELVRGDKDMDAYSVRNYTEHLSVLDGHAVSYSLPNAVMEPLDSDGNKIVSYPEFRANLRARKLFEVPSEKGLCFPYVFLKDSKEQSYRRVVGAYKLKHHPEITVEFYDEAGLFVNQNVSPNRRVMAHWSIYNYKNIERSSIKMAGRDGAASFSEFWRNDDVEDFGYFAYVKGDDKTALDTPTLSLLVIRDSKYAKGMPMGKAEFMLLAEQITASVKYRAPGPMANPPRKPEPAPTPLPQNTGEITDAAGPATPAVVIPKRQ